MQAKADVPRLNGNKHRVDLTSPGVAAAEHSVSALTREFHNVFADIEDLIKRTTSLSGEDLALAKDKLNEKVAEARGSVAEMGDLIAEQARRATKRTNRYLHQHSLLTLGVSAAVGMVVGFVLARR